MIVWSAEEAAGETVVIITVRALCFVVLKDSWGHKCMGGEGKLSVQLYGWAVGGGGKRF